MTAGQAFRALFKMAPPTPWLDLDDRHFVSGLTGWSLQTATGINAQGDIVGNGHKDGAKRGFVLIHRAAKN